MADTSQRKTSAGQSYMSIASNADSDGVLIQKEVNDSERGKSWIGSIFGLCNYYLNPIVFISSVIAIWGFVLWFIIDKDAKESIKTLQNRLFIN